MKIKHRKTGIIYSLVSFEKEKIFKLNYQEKINSTLDLMYKATHSYMFRLLNNYETENHLGLIFESFEGDSLDNLILKGKCDIQTSLKYLVEVIFGIIHINDLGLYNLNIRPEYILVDECIIIIFINIKHVIFYIFYSFFSLIFSFSIHNFQTFSFPDNHLQHL